MFGFLNMLRDWFTNHRWSHDDTATAMSRDDYYRRSMFDDGTGIGCAGSLVNQEDTVINPATGLLMIGGMAGIDTAGNPYGTDLHDHFGSDAFSDHRWDF